MALARIVDGMASTSSGSVSSTCPSASITSDIGPPSRGGRNSINTKIERIGSTVKRRVLRQTDGLGRLLVRRRRVCRLAEAQRVLRDHVPEHLEGAAVDADQR